MYFIYLKRLNCITLAAGQEPHFSGRIFQNTRIFTTYSTVLASGRARRDPPRHVDVVIQILVNVALFREKSLVLMVYRGAMASGTVSRVPGRSTCIGHTKDELRRASDGRVMII